jgi:hypothetical protein
MTDSELQAWWPEMGAVVTDLRCIDRSDVADLFVDAIRAGSCSSEVLGGVGVVLRDHYELRSRLSDHAIIAWDKVSADVCRAFPGLILRHWLYRLKKFCHISALNMGNCGKKQESGNVTARAPALDARDKRR